MDILNSFSFPVAILSRRGYRILYTNESFGELLQLPSKNFIQKKISKFLNEPIKIARITKKAKKETDTDNLFLRKIIGDKSAQQEEYVFIKMFTSPALQNSLKDLSETSEYEIIAFFFRLPSKDMFFKTLTEDILLEVCHDISSPLHGMHGMLDLLLETKLNQNQKYYVEVIKKTNVTIKNIIYNIFTLRSNQREISIKEKSYYNSRYDSLFISNIS